MADEDAPQVTLRKPDDARDPSELPRDLGSWTPAELEWVLAMIEHSIDRSMAMLKHARDH